MSESTPRPSDFIRDMVARDVAAGKHGGVVRTRFPPEPNGYLHIGHAKSVCLNFGLAQEFKGVCHLRFDDTNPETEDQEYVEAILRDVRWLGFEWGDKLFYASDYYDELYRLAEKLIGLGRAYVCDCDEETVSRLRGSVTEPGTPCEHRSRTDEESLALFRRMRNHEFKDGEKVLRARIDLSAPNMKLRDPAIYRIKTAHHYRSGDKWCIYPLYDFAHCLSDSMEGITHSLCTMEYESARALYDWVLRACEMPWLSEQTEFARLNLTYTVMSKRKLLELVERKDVSGWDDPRMPTISGMRRRGYTPEAIRDFCGRIGVAKNLSTIDVALLEHAVREDLDQRAPRVMGVLRPLKLTVTSFAGGTADELDAPYWPADAGKSGSRKVPFTRELFIEREDFAEQPPKDWKRLAPGRSVRLRHAFIVTCTEVVKDAEGNVVEVKATHDPATRGGAAQAGQKVDGTIHWVSAARSIDADVRLFDRLFTTENPGADGDFRKDLNPKSLDVVRARVEPSLANARAGDRFQLERQGFFVVDPDSKPGALVLGRTVTLKDSWARAGKAAEVKPKKAAPPKQAAAAKAELSASAAELQQKHGLNDDEARTLDAEPGLRELFENAVRAGAPKKEAATLIVNDLRGELRARKLDRPALGGAQIAELIALLQAGTHTSRLAKDVLGEMLSGGGSPREIVEKRGLTAISDSSALDAVVRKVVEANPELVGRVKAGNANVIGALLGMAMRESGGRANPKALREVLEKALR